MKLRSGQQYVRNDGKVITVFAFENPGSGYVFHDRENNNSYTEDGIHGDNEWDEDWNIAGPYVPKEKR